MAFFILQILIPYIKIVFESVILYGNSPYGIFYFMKKFIWKIFFVLKEIQEYGIFGKKILGKRFWEKDFGKKILGKNFYF